MHNNFQMTIEDFHFDPALPVWLQDKELKRKKFFLGKSPIDWLVAVFLLRDLKIKREFFALGFLKI